MAENVSRRAGYNGHGTVRRQGSLCAAPCCLTLVHIRCACRVLRGLLCVPVNGCYRDHEPCVARASASVSLGVIELSDNSRLIETFSGESKYQNQRLKIRPGLEQISTVSPVHRLMADGESPAGVNDCGLECYHPQLCLRLTVKWTTSSCNPVFAGIL